MHMGDILPINARRNPGKVAISDMRGSLTYGDLDARTNSLSNALLELNVKQRTNVAILVGNRSEHIEIILALAKIGVVGVPMDTKWKSRELAGGLSFFDIKAIIAETSMAKELSEALNQVPQFQGPLIWIGGRPSGFKFSAYEYERLIAKTSSALPHIAVNSEDIFLIMITSGTTGFPKGCLITHQSYIYRCLNQAVGHGVDANNIELAVVPICFNSGRGSVLAHMFFGAKTIVKDKFDPVDTMTTIEREKVSYIGLAPVQCDRILQLPDLDQYDTSSLTCLRKAGAPFIRRTLEGLIEHVTPHIYQSYSSTDAGTISRLGPKEQLAKCGSSGRLIWAADVLLVNNEGQPVQAGEVGEIICRSPLASIGYYNNPEANAASYRDGWLLTGDLGRFDEDGYLYIVGRKKNLIKSGSISIFPEEIQEVLQGHPSVWEAAVIGLPDAEWGEAVTAVVSLRSGESLSAEELIGYCKARLAPYKAPKTVRFADELPHTELGKVAVEIVKSRVLRDLAKEEPV
jgi:acyl-CoA synthetase (AMP-forming)/AMP-acid ligase II